MTFKKNLSEFKRYLASSLYINPAEQEIFEQIPEDFYASIFRNNFNADLELAKQVLFKEFKNIDKTDLIDQTKRIHNYKRAMKTLKGYLDSDKPVVFVTDIDNDGSLSQAVILEFKRQFPEKSKNIHIIYSQNINGNTNRGFTVDLLEKWAGENGISKDEDFLMLSADNGVNNLDEQQKIEKMFSKCNMIITDHHLPDPDSVIQDTKRTCLFNPKNKPIKAFKGDKNISGAHTLGVLLQNTALDYDPEINIRNFENLCYGANLLDYVNSDIRMKPLEKHMINTFSKLGALLNVNNSISKIITGDTSEEAVFSVIKNIPEINKEEFMDALLVIEEQNLVASKLLLIQQRFETYNDEEKSKLDEKSFYNDNIQGIISEDKFTHFNTNYIEQLRPRIYHHSVNGEKSSYEQAMLESMEKVFKNVQKAEKRLIKEMRKGDIMNTFKSESSTVMYPKYPEINTLFNRKFLNKVYNEEINGFLTMFDSAEKSKRMGSCRSLFNLSDMLADTSKLPDYIDLSFQGHEKAAGFFVERNDGKTLTNKDMTIVGEFMQERVDILKEEQEYNQKYVLVDFHNVGLVQKINSQVKAHVNNVSGVNPVIKLNRSMHFTDTKTLKTVSIGQLLKNEKYGYTPLKLNFHGDTIIVPTEIIRQLSKNNFKDYLQVNYMAEGAFIAYKVVKADRLKPSDIVKLDSPKKEQQEEISLYYKENFVDKNTYVKTVPRERMKEVDFFKNNGSYGDAEFAAVESFFIGVIDKYTEQLNNPKEPVTLVIADTEANGLGKAPKLFNFGAFEVTIDPDSGREIPLDKFMAQYSKNKDVFDASPMNIKFDIPNNKVILNRRIKGELLSMLIRDKDFKLTQEIQALTGISQAMLNKLGITTGEADNILAERYAGKPLIFQAHNSNYDVNVLAVNTPKLKTIVDENMVCDSARFAKEQRLAYPDTYVATLCSEASKAFFFNDPLADYSISKMLAKEEDIQFPDIRGDYLVKTKAEDVYLINLKNDVEVKLPYTKAELAESVNSRNTDLHLNMLKYSVVALAKFENIRAVVLHDLKQTINFIDTPVDILNNEDCVEKFDEAVSDKLFKEFCKDYHFDVNVRTNLEHFRDAIEMQVKDGTRDPEELFLFCPEKRRSDDDDVEAKPKKKAKKSTAVVDPDAPKSFYELFSNASLQFLQENKSLHLRFTTIWEYQKILDVYDPAIPVSEMDDLVLKGVCHNTGLPQDRVEDVLNNVYNYKKAYGLKNIYTEELHNNIDENGDAMIEGLLIGQRLIRKHYNPYAKQKNFATAVQIYHDTTNTTSYRNVLRQQIEEDIAEVKVNAYSQKQAETYSKKRMDEKGEVHLSPIIQNAYDPKHTKWKIRCLPQGSFIEARPDESFILNKLFGKVEAATFNSDIEEDSLISDFDVMKAFEVEVQGKAAKITPKMAELLVDIDRTPLLKLSKEREIINKITYLADRKVVEHMISLKGINKGLKSGLEDILEEGNRKLKTYTAYLEKAFPDKLDAIEDRVSTIIDENFSAEQFEAAKVEKGSFLKTKSLSMAEKDDIEKKMEFISKRILIGNSLNKSKGINSETVEAINEMLEKTKATADTYMVDIEDRIGNLNFSRSENEIKKIVEQMWDSMRGKGRFITSPKHHKEYYNEFYIDLLKQYESLAERLGDTVHEENYSQIVEEVKTWQESPYYDFETSLDGFKRTPTQFITEDCDELMRNFLQSQIKREKILGNDLSDIFGNLEEKKKQKKTLTKK
jgi:hypothetical protein